MNPTFNLSRFALVSKLYWAENGKSYLISLGLLIGGMLLLMTPILATQYYNDMLYILHITALFGVMLGSSLFTSTAFNAYSIPSQGIQAIMLPASRLEKYLVILLINLFFAVSVAAIFYLLHHGIVDMANEHIHPNNRRYQMAPPEVLRFFGYSYFLIQGLTFLGSLYFTKNAYIKTLGVLLVIVVIAFLFNSFFAYQFTDSPSFVRAFPFTSWMVFLDRYYTINYPESISNLIKVFLGALVVALWYITYVRLKEKEI